MTGTLSAIWQGSVRHRRFAPRAHAFSYNLFMLGLDLDELSQLDRGRWFGVERAGLLSFHRDDYLRGSEGPLKQAVWQKVSELGGDAEPEGRVLLLGNVRCLGFYFSPVNFYFCYRQERLAICWRRCRIPLERAPLLPAGSGGAGPHDKDFHVSPSWDWRCATTGAFVRPRRRH